MRSHTRFWVSAALAAMTTLVHAQAHWLTATSGNWSDTTKWAGGVAPGSGTVYIDYDPWSLTGSPGSFTTNLNYSVNLAGLYSKANLTMTGVNLGLSTTGSILDGAFTMDGGDIHDGGMTFNGLVTLTGAAKTFNGTTLVFNGPASQSNHVIYAVNSTLTFNNVFTVTDGRTRDGIMNIGPTGTMRKGTGAGIYYVGESHYGGPAQLNNSGLVESLSGTINPLKGGTHTGTFRGSGGTVLFTTGTQNMLAGSRIESGTVIDGATIHIPSATDSLQLVGTPEWISGALSGAEGRLVGLGTLRASTTNSKYLSGSVVNQSNLEVLGGVIYAVNSTFRNQGSVVLGGTPRYRDGLFINEGTLTKSGVGQAFVAESYNGGPRSFDNFGTVTVTGGTLTSYGNGSHTGTFTGSGGNIEFVGATQTFLPGHVLNSGVDLVSGSFLIPDGGTLNCAGAVNFLGGTMARSGTTGVGNFGGAGSLNVTSTTVWFDTVLRNTGTLNCSASVMYATNATVTNAGTINLPSTGRIRDGIWNNTGLVHKYGTGEFLLAEYYYGGTQSFNNSGTVTASAGTLRMMNSGTHSGLFNATGGTINWPSGNQTCNTGTVFNGSNNFTGTTITVPAGHQAQFVGSTFSGGTLTGGGTLAGAGPFLWSGTGTVGGSLSSNVPINQVSNATYFTNATFTNNSTLTMNAGLNRDGRIINNGVLKSVSGTNTASEIYYGGLVELNNNGQVIADSSTLLFKANGSHQGSFRTANGGLVHFTGGTHTLRNGSVLGTGTATSTPVVCNESTMIEGESEWRSGTWSGTGTLYGDTWRMTTGVGHILEGSLTCAADFNLEDGTLYGTNASFTFDNDCVATVSDGIVVRDGVWTNRGRVQKVAGPGLVALGTHYYGGSRGWTNEGTLHCESGTLRLDNPLANWDNASSTMNGGIYSAKGTGNLRLPLSNGVVTNLARFILDGAGALITRDNGTTPALNVIASNQGGLELYGGATLTPPGAFANSGDVIVGVGSSLTPVTSYTQTDGHTKVNGTINKLLTVSGGRLSGKGAFAGANLTTTLVAPGDAVGTLSSSADVNMTNSTFDAKVAGAGAGQFSKLLVTGTAAITNSTLTADAAPNSTVPSGTVVDVITASTRTGTFAVVPPVTDWSVSYGATYVRLTANRTIMGPIQIAGDLDLNGYVAGYAPVPLSYDLEQGGTKIESQTLHPFADRTYAYITRLRGNFDLVVRGSHWLIRRISGLSLTDAGVSGLSLELINGDIDEDNEIGPGDFGMLSSSFGSVEGDPNWVANADLDGDGEIGPSDFGILSANFGFAGD